MCSTCQLYVSDLMLRVCLFACVLGYLFCVGQCVGVWQRIERAQSINYIPNM